MIILDTECYSDYFLIMFKDTETSKIRYFELFPGKALNAAAIHDIMEWNTTVSFNGLGYDLPLIVAALEGWDNAHLKKFSDSIIKSNKPSWSVCKNNNIRTPLDKWDHIDLIAVAPGIASLKLYGARLGAPRIQDLPIDPDDSIEPDQREELRTYCKNDLDTTELLYNTLKAQIALRESMSEQYGIDLRSKSDAQIAEAVIKSELEKLTKRKYRKPKVKDGAKVRYQDPKIVSFQAQELKDVFERILDHEFEFMGNGSIKLPKWLKSTPIIIGGRKYNVGIGGLHSNEKSQLIEARDGVLCDWDVSSYYPSIILQQRLSPKTMGKDFLNLYQSLVTRRLEAKASGDMVTANTLKICLNGSFGKLGSKYSALYAPELLLQTTITGQLCLLMLIEQMELAGVSIVSANTDGIVCQCPKDKERIMEMVAWEWELETSYALERTDYKLVASRDVNSYFAVKTNGKVKRKGIFNQSGLMKNPDRSIVYDAVVEFLANGTPIEETVTGCKDVNKFVSARKVTGGAKWDGELLGKTVRFYSSTDAIMVDPAIHYAVNGNKVPKSAGCRPLMELCDGVPGDLNYQAYVDEARKLLLDVGYSENNS